MRIKMLLILFLMIQYSSSANVEDQSFKVNYGGTITISLTSAEININTWNRPEVQIRTGDDERLDIRYQANSLTINSRHGDVSELMINIPEKFNVNIKLTAGDVRLMGSLSGNLEIRNSGGDVSFNDIKGDVNLTTGGGNIKGNNVTGGVNIKSFGGDIYLGDIKGSTRIETGGGNIRLRDIKKVEFIKTAGGNIIMNDVLGNGSIITGGGNIDVKRIEGNTSIFSSGGNIKVRESDGKITVKTNAGEIRIREAKGSLNAFTESGDILINLTRETKTTELFSRNGDIRVNVPADLNATITAKSKDPGWWRDDNDFQETFKSDFKAATVSKNKKNQEVEVIYKLNSGAAEVKIRNEHGEIILKRI
jgi:hypothetical protein